MEKQVEWELEKWDGELIPVKPQNVEFVKGKLASGEGFINTPNRSIAVKDIKDFRATSRTYSTQKTLSAGAMADIPAFGLEVTPGGAVNSRWVKKSVNRRDYNKLYSHGIGYRLLRDDEAYVWIAFKLPRHAIDYSKVYDCTPDEITRLERY